jgi:hypothetical protein
MRYRLLFLQFHIKIFFNAILRFCLDLIDAAVPDEERRGGDIRGSSRTPIS